MDFANFLASFGPATILFVNKDAIILDDSTPGTGSSCIELLPTSTNFAGTLLANSTTHSAVTPRTTGNNKISDLDNADESSSWIFEEIDGVYISVHLYLLVYKPRQFEEFLARLLAKSYPPLIAQIKKNQYQYFCISDWTIQHWHFSQHQQLQKPMQKFLLSFLHS